MEDFDHDALMREFLNETQESLVTFEQALLALESNPSDVELLNTLFRVAHTLKGNALCVGCEGVGALAHILEDTLDRLRSGAAVAGVRVISWLLEAVDALREVVQSIADGTETVTAQHEQIFDTLDELTSSSSHGIARPELAKVQSAAAIEQSVSTLRVDIGKLDRMVDLSGEIAVARARMRQRLEDARAVLGDELLDSYREVDRLSFELQEYVMKIRMVPIGPTLRQFSRTVRDTASALSKSARLEVEGEDVEIDTRVIERLKDPLLHMVRNAVGHGLESPETRTANGKDATGTITLSARHEGGSIVIHVEDDGAGIDRGRLLARARRDPSVADADALSDEDLLRLIFNPGFSTAENVTDVSGRGVGLDVVKKNIEELHGTLTIASRAGGGTRFTARLPLTLAIIDGFMVDVADAAYIVPMESVVECIGFSGDEAPTGRTGVMQVRGEVLPYMNLRTWFGAGGHGTGRQNVVVVQHDKFKAGLIVDALRGETQTVIKPLGRLLQNVPGVSASAITGDGRVALILDVQDLLATAARSQNTAAVSTRGVA